jgi:hypothetical protein
VAVATYGDVEVSLGRPISTAAEQQQVEWWLTGLEHVLAHRLGDLSELDQDVLLYVEVEAAVAKILRRDNRETSVTVSVDDGSVTRRYEAASAGDVMDEWWALLSPAVDSGAGFSTRPAFEPDTSPSLEDLWA